MGLPVIDSTYEKVTIRIAFQPIEEKFEVLNDITLKIQPGRPGAGP